VQSSLNRNLSFIDVVRFGTMAGRILGLIVGTMMTRVDHLSHGSLVRAVSSATN
jgi:hypothetical protein